MKTPKTPMVICENCGANFNDIEPKCPYCNHMHLPGALNEYEEKLEDIKDDLEDIKDDVSEVYVTNAKKQTKIIITIITILFSIVLLAIGASMLFEHLTYQQFVLTDEEIRLQKAWELENFPYLDELYAKGEYAAILEFQMLQFETEEDYVYTIYNWENYEFIEKYSMYLNFVELTDTYGENTSRDAFNLADTLHLIFEDLNDYGNQYLSEEQRETIIGYQNEARAYLASELGIDEQKLNDFYNESVDEYQYLNFSATIDYAEEYLENINKQ